MAGVKRKLVAAAGAASILLCQGAAAASWISPRVPAPAPRRLHSHPQGGHGDGGGGRPSRARAPTEPAPFHSSSSSSSSSSSFNTKPLPDPPSSLSSSSSLLEALPMHDPALFRGRWTISASNQLLTEDSTGFVTLEVDTGPTNGDPGATFKAMGHTKQGPPFLSSQVTRNGSFTLLLDPQPDKEASGIAGAAAAEEGGAWGKQQEVVGEIEFHTDEIQPVLGLPLPAPSHVRDLGGKRRRVHVRVEDVNSITLFFPSTRTFYLLERASPAAQQEAAAAAGGGAPPLAVLITTNIVSLLASGIAEGLKHEAATLFDAIMRR